MTTPGANLGQYAFTQAPISVAGAGGMGPNPAYGAGTNSGIGNHDYMESPSGSWAPHLEEAPGNYPDPSRLADIPRRDYRPEPAVPPDYFWSGLVGPGRERLQRHGVEFQDADGFEENHPPPKPMAPNPRSIPPPTTRATSFLAPRTYLFTRPWNTETTRYFNGNHFSMADHRRKYPILGMAPFTRKRNTYRVDPAPWDSDFVDAPPPVQPETPGRIIAVDLPPSGGQSWRL